MSDYESQRQQHVTRALALAPRLIDQLSWPADRLAEHRTLRLRELVRISTERSRWYRKRLSGVDIDRLDESALAELPVLTKAELMEHFDDIVTDCRLTLAGVDQYLNATETGSYLLGRYTAITSGGSSGQRGVFVYDWDPWAVFWLTCFRTLLRAQGPLPRPRLPSGRDGQRDRGPLQPRHRGHGPDVQQPADDHRPAPGHASHRGDRERPERGPAGLHAPSTPRSCTRWPHEAAAGRLRIAPRQVLAGAEPLLPETRAAAEQAWGVPVINIYGTSEGGGTAVGCEHGGTHISEDQLIVEPVDLAGRTVPPGDRSAKVYLTNLYNPVLPLIRYEITDEITVLPGRCACGSAHRRIADVQGRLDDEFIYQDLRVHPHLFRTALSREAGVVEYQVRQTPGGAAIAIRCTAPVSVNGLRDRIATALASAGLDRPQVTVVVVDRFERPGGPAKLKRFLPLDQAPGLPQSAR